MRRGIGIHGRDAHQALDRQAIGPPAGGDEGVGLGGRDPGLLLFLADVDLDIEARGLAGTLDLLGQHAGQLVAVESLDDVEEGHRLAGLIGLQRTDQPQLQTLAMRAPAFHGLLNAVLAIDFLPRRQHGRDMLPGLGLGHRHQSHRTRRSSGARLGGGDAVLDLDESV